MKKDRFNAIEREKKYPVLTALDLLVHQALALSVIGILGLAFWKCVWQSPQLTASVAILSSRLLGINLD